LNHREENYNPNPDSLVGADSRGKSNILRKLNLE
jgi:hypothetical protein